MPKVTQRQFLVKVAGIDGYWATKSGGNITSDNNKVWDGGNPVSEIVTGPTNVENITISRPYDAARDAVLLRRLRRNMVGTWTTTLSFTETDRDLIAIGEPTVYPDAVLVSMNEPEVDATSSDPATVELEFAVTGVR